MALAVEIFVLKKPNDESAEESERECSMSKVGNVTTIT
jgi:hypothetical protein